MTATYTESREKRMLDAMLEHGNRNARIVVTVTLARADGRELHQAFRFKAWDGRDGKMLTADLMDGDWAAGVKATKVAHVNLNRPAGSTSKRTFPAKNDGVEYGDQLVIYACRAAVQWLTSGTVPQPANGTVACVTSDYCSCCGRELTDDTSIALGIGPECERKVYGTRTKRSGTITGRRSVAPVAGDAQAVREHVQTTLGDEAAQILDDHFALAAAVGDTPAQRHTLADDLAGRAGGFAILQNGMKVAHADDSREAMEMASGFYRRSPHLRFTVVDEANGELVVEYDA